MQSAAVPCTGNGIKRTAANALSSSSSPPTSSSNQNDHSNHTQSDSPPPPEKRSFIVVESPIKLETISSAEDLDIKVLRIQNKNLSERLVQRQKLETELRDKIDKLQNRKASDDSKLCIIDRYWTQLDEDLRLMLERFDSNDSSKDSNSSDINSASKSSSSKTNKENLGLKGSSQPVRNFLAKLNDWDKSEVDDSLKERVKFTTQTVSKLITIYDRLVKKNDLYFKELTSQNSNITQESMDTSSNNSATNEKKLKELYEENVKLNDLITVCQQKLHSNGIEKKELEDKIALLENELKELNTKSDETEYELDKIRDKAFKLDRQLADTLTKLNNIQKQTNLSTTNHVNHIDQNGHIVYHNNLNQSTANSSNNNNNNNNNRTNNISDKQISDLEFELEQQKELASNRLHELEKLNQELLTSNKQIEKLKADLKTIPESVIEQTSEYRMLQTKYSLIVNDNIKLKQALDETRSILEMSRITFQRQLEQMESEELAQQKRLGNEMMQIEEQLAQVRKENELLRIEYEQNLAANEQTGPINKEMRSLITTLQTNNKLLKSDNLRTKKRLEEAQQEIERLKNKSTQLQTQLQQLNAKNSSSDNIKTENNSSNNQTTTECSMNNLKTEPPDMNNCTNIKTESLDIDVNRENDESKDSIIKDLKEKNRKLQENQKDIKNIIDIYSKTTNSSSNSNSSSSSSNSSVSSSSSSSSSLNSTSKEKKYLNELEEAKIEIKRLKECLEKLKSTSTSSSQNTTPSSSSSRLIIPTQQIPSNSPSTSNHTPSSARYHHNKTEHHHSDESCNTPNSSTPNQSSSSSDLTKKIKSLEETVKELQKSLSNKKQEESALLTDMEITGQAFEDMQEQNIRLMQQLREKDDANFKLVSERIKLENVQKILKEEKEIFSQQVITLQEQQEVQINVSKKLEEQIQLLTQSIAILEKEVIQLQQTCETYKRQAVDNVQLIQELKLNSQKYLLQLKEAQQQIAEKSDLLASHTFTNKRTQEEIKHLQSKLERQKKFEMAANMDEVLKEEIKEYKEQLRCPSCKIKQKDAVLTKCFHVFCFDCLQKRYESRQRKCPKCNAGFGANDYRKLYLS